jgi:hypothetical protein
LGRAAPEENPSLWSIRNWVLRLGLHELQRPKPRASDWALILDHTLPVGSYKALLVLGVRLAELARKNFQLRHQDVSVLGLEIGQQSNSQTVLALLDQIQGRIGTPRLLISDAGSDLKAAGQCFSQAHPQTDWIGDVSHRMARLVAAEFKADPEWECFVHQAACCRSQCQQTALSPWRPPAPRAKARWMNCLPLVNWAQTLLVDQPPLSAQPEAYRRQFGWLDDYQDSMGDYWMMLHLVQETCRIIKKGGIGKSSIAACRQMLSERVSGKRVRRFASGIREYLCEVESKVRPGERLLGSSDIIESLFGKYKLLLERSPQQAMTRLVLAIGAVTSDRTPERVREAMESVSIKAVSQWFEKYVPQSATTLRRKGLFRLGTLHA